ncbi:hypothetical protein GCM10009810_32940 [Nostocoides vanveenii]|uniref:Uncharacterized protein n=1 Tax=Nostocoides vanveenii TaxID=330835 RepID=A0ABN2L5A3_9MICO
MRLSASAASDDSEVISDQKLPQRTVAPIATSGSSTKAAPTAAGNNSHRGSEPYASGRRIGRSVTVGA